MNVKRSLHKAGKDTSSKFYVLITMVIMIVVLPHLYETWCGWTTYP